MTATLSYVHGASTQPLLGETVGACLGLAAARCPDVEALVVPYQGVRWSYAELDERVHAFAGGLVALGLEPGDRVGVWAPNCAEWVVSQFATARAGLILVNINPAYRAAEVETALRTVGCKALITAPSFKSTDCLAILSDLLPELADATPGELQARALPELRTLIRLGSETTAGMFNFDQLGVPDGNSHRATLQELQTRLQFDDPINIQFTSGTTGAPKAATLTHHNIVNNAYFVGRRMGLMRGDRLCVPVPMYHCFGMVLGTLCAVTHEATVVFSSAGFDAHAVLETVQAERCTALHGVPTMFIAELDDADFARYDLSSLRTGIMAGAPCPRELMERVMTQMHLAGLTIAYGMTETGPVSFQTAPDDPVEQRVATVGTVLAHTEVKIVDADGRMVPRGTTGELCTRGYCVMPGYWNDAQRTGEAIDSAGWIASGDLAFIDTEGYCHITGRIKDMLIRGGENIYPSEIEALLYQHPDVEQVEVIGVPDRKYGEEVCAWIKLREDESATSDEIRAFCKGRIAHFKIPRYIRFVDSFPMTVTGKVQKFVMRDRMKELLEQQAAESGDGVKTPGVEHG